MHCKTKNYLQEILNNTQLASRPTNPRSNKKLKSAFTIVELLIVIVIIGIIATIVIIFYIGTHEKAIDGSLQADLKNSSTILELDKVNSDIYPANKESANSGKGLKPSNGATFDYIYNDGDNSYCLTASKEGRSYYIDSAGKVPKRGTCPVGNLASFSRTWGGWGNEFANTLIQTSDKGFAIAGVTDSYGAGDGDAFIAKFAADGTLSWSRTWGGTDLDYASSLIQASDGSYAITGHTLSYGSGDTDAFIAKFTADGNLSWSKIWNGGDDDYANSLIQTSNGSFVISGDTRNYDTGDTDAFIAKFTADGNLSWSKTWGGSKTDCARSIIQTSDNNLVIAGYTHSYGTGDTDAFIAKFTADGNLSWSKTWGGWLTDRADSLVQTNDGGFAIAGETSSYDISNGDAFIAKFTADGDLSWSKTWGGAKGDWALSLIQTGDGGLATAGRTFTYGTGSADAFIAKFTADGTLSWSRTWGGTDLDYASSLIQASDGSYAITGGTGSYGNGDGDVFVSMYATDGSINTCPLSMCQSPTAMTTSPTAATTSPTATITSPTIAIASPAATTTNPTAISTNAIPMPTPQMTQTFSAQELYIAFPGDDQAVCKEWTVPNGKTIKGFLISQETDEYWDYFTVSLDGVRIYYRSGVITDKYIDTSATPGNTLKACIYTDSDNQYGYGGQVTSVVYN